MKSASEDLRESMSSKGDEELYDILSGHSQDYTADTVEAARLEFGRRALDVPTLDAIAATVGRAREREDAQLGWGLRIVAFFVSSAIVFIPVILAHRHF